MPRLHFSDGFFFQPYYFRECLKRKVINQESRSNSLSFPSQRLYDCNSCCRDVLFQEKSTRPSESVSKSTVLKSPLTNEFSLALSQTYLGEYCYNFAIMAAEDWHVFIRNSCRFYYTSRTNVATTWPKWRLRLRRCFEGRQSSNHLRLACRVGPRYQPRP